MIAKISTFKLNGIEAVPVTVECEVTSGIGIHLVGLADQAVKESLLRIVTALQAIGYRIPGKKVVINLAPADLHKKGSGYDLPIAISIIAASGQEELPDLDKYVLAGELGLDGSLRDIPGWLQIAELANKSGKCCILPRESAKLAARALHGEVTIYGADGLKEVIDILNNGAPERTALDEVMDDSEMDVEAFDYFYDWWNATPGHDAEKRALEIAAAGGHPILLIGVPGSEKQALAKSMLSILPPMSAEEAMDVQRIYSAADRRIVPDVRPFREISSIPSMSALLGGGLGDNIAPGAVSLAHAGILYIDQLSDMPKSLLEGMRGPLEDSKVTISRLRNKVDYPAKFFPVFASNPCPCGYYGDGDRCTCTLGQRVAYLARLSGPVSDRLTMQVWTHPNQPGATLGEPSQIVAERVRKARERQIERQGKLNDELNATEAEEACGISGEYGGEDIFNAVEELISKLNLSFRAYSRTLKIARTIADLEGSEQIQKQHLTEAVSFRFLDRRKF